MKSFKTVKLAICLFAILFFLNCSSDTSHPENKNSANIKPSENQTAGYGKSENSDEAEKTANTETIKPASNKEPKTVRDFFMLVPAKYFEIECCDQGKEGYLKNFLTVEDTANGYLEGGGDGAQGAFKMALFKRPDGTFIIGFNSFHESENAYYFLTYENGKWSDVSLEVVPEYSGKNMYEFPRFGTTIPVFAKKIIEEGEDYEVSEKGEKLYDLEWKNGEFRIKK